MILLIEQGDKVWFSWSQTANAHCVYQIEPPPPDHPTADEYKPVSTLSYTQGSEVIMAHSCCCYRYINCSGKFLILWFICEFQSTLFTIYMYVTICRCDLFPHLNKNVPVCWV